MPRLLIQRRLRGACLDLIPILLLSLLSLLIDPRLLLPVGLIIVILYFTLTECRKGASPGKRIVGLRVVREDGRPLSTADILRRSTCTALALLPLGFGFLMAFFREDACGLHDLLSHTRVIRANEPFAAHPRVVVTGEYLNGKTYEICRDGVVIGRGSGCDLVYPPVSGVSRRHCRVMYDSRRRGFVLYDLGSTYGTYFSGRRIPSYGHVRLTPGDEFWLAKSAYTFRVMLGEPKPCTPETTVSQKSNQQGN